MSIAVICGINWGDEGKGRIVDYLAQNADVVVRYQGGNNAGHTVINEFGTFKLHLIPSGIFNPEVTNVLGPGMVIDLESLSDEIAYLKAAQIDVSKIYVSERATICFPFHRYEDIWEEERLIDKAFGSTKKGIAPCYSDRYLKKGIQVGELLQPDLFKKRLRQIVDWKNLITKAVYQKGTTFSYDEMLNWSLTFGNQIKHLISDTVELLEKSVTDGKRILFEAQLGGLRDIYFGIYPYTSSSSSLAGFAPVGGGLFGYSPDRVIGVMKAFSTCVGEGPFVTEIKGQLSEQLREIGHEYGAATGRPRRIGYFDAVASLYGAKIQGVTEIAFTKLDCLTGLDKIPICTHYEVNGQLTNRFPLNGFLEISRPVYIEMEGWNEDISSCRSFEKLPRSAREYILKIEQLVNCYIRYVSVGPERESLIDRGRNFEI
jgi:adenylosuccinate synthase